MIGKRIYYDKRNGNILQTTFESPESSETASTVEQDIEFYYTLKNVNRDIIGMIQLDYGQYSQDFAESQGHFRVNIDKLVGKSPEKFHEALEFSYPDPNEPKAPPVYIKPLTEQVAELEAQNMELMLAVAELSDANETDKIETQLAIAELASMVMEGK